MNRLAGRLMPGFAASCTAVIVLLTAVSAAAQAPRADRPYRGLFGAGYGSFDQQLSVNGSLGAGWDDNLLAEARGRSTTSFSPRQSDLNSSHRGTLGTATASLNYAMNKDRVSARASGATMARYYPSLATDFIRRDYANAGVNATLGRGFSAGADANYRPYSLASWFPGLIDPRTGDPALDEDFPASSEHYFAYTGNVGFNHQFSVRTSMDLDGAYRVRESSARAARFVSRSAGGGLSHNLTRDLALRVGYRVTEALYDNGRSRPLMHTIDLGVNYNHALSVSRRTMLSFSTGTTAVTRQTTADTSQFRARTLFRAVGSAVLTHEIGRTWYTSAAYNRGLTFNDSWPEPVFYDAVTLGLNGSVSRRVGINAVARAADGRRALSSARSKLRTYYGSVGVTYALNRFMNSGATYAYYNHRFDDTFLLAPGFPSQVSRRSVHVYLSFFAPVFQRSRRQ